MKSLKLISLAPTQTEIVAALGAVEDLAGLTEDCDFPDCVRRLPRFGSWYSPDIRAILDASPDLVLTFGSRQEEVREILEESGVRVYHSEPPTIAAAFATFGEIASLIGRADNCGRLIDSLEKRLGLIRKNLESAAGHRRPSVFRIMNWDPLITPGPGAFQNDVIEFAGGANMGGDGPAAYFVCDPEQIRARDPEIIFFCEPWIKGCLENDAKWAKVNAVRNGRIYLYDCGLTCRAGPRIVEMAEELNGVVLDFMHLPSSCPSGNAG
ncbi:MAG TPA: ABC transporter substrate-binding protein [Deltaproteobacteria bacterium]|jgi:iron complex transport system substrate-binding protein|nr:ABC transporter substrate-binding protein [Deltaproteobacteria bacterium]HIJ75750.1 ABC transporter substrate-binding protein [Deltaproteobacteria bacterium]